MISYSNNGNKLSQAVFGFLALVASIRANASPIVLKTSAGTVSGIPITI